ncbi:Secreted phosphoprotein 24 [Liparis tanakae]|uniref:Secreted phosphoprotein 24 n=1 Tax=Liparis tanakae TaxID=230148 RepID=A0A4Z2GE58_9TELE|nr:Secreted phosphoprotein 24 [Liparis tanakae]
MKSCVLLWALLHTLGCSGSPLYASEVSSLADRALGAALAQVNSDHVRFLYRVTRGSVKKIIPLSPDTTDLLLAFGVKETECVKASGRDPLTCAFRAGFFVPSSSCTSRVRMSPTSAQVVSLRCGDDSSSSSSSESSEEPGLSLQGRTEARHRGDTFTNYLHSSGGGGGSAASSTAPAGSALPGLRDPGRLTDFRFSVRWRSSRKLCWPAPPFGEVGGGGDSGGGSGVALPRRTSVGGGVFFSELFPHVELLTRETGGGGGGAWGWGFTTATRGGPPLWPSLPGGGGGGKSSEAGGGGGK